MEITPEQIKKFETFLLSHQDDMYSITEIVNHTKIPREIVVQAMQFYVMESVEQEETLYYSISYGIPEDILSVFSNCPICNNPVTVSGASMLEKPIYGGRRARITDAGMGAMFCNHCKLYLAVAKRYAIFRKCYCQIVWGKPKRQTWLWIRNHRWQCTNCGCVEVWRTENRPEVDHIGLYVIGTGNNPKEVTITDKDILARWREWKELERTGELYEKWC